MNPHFKVLEAAYQLHFYFCLKTHFLKPHLATPEAEKLVSKVLERVCQREQYHLLQLDVSATQLRLLLSLKPTHAVSQVVRLLKGNLERDFRNSFRMEKLLGRGYFVRSSGKASLEAARKYVENQVTHHGYKGDWTKPLKFRNPNFKSPAFTFEHCAALLTYHLVLVTQTRLPIFEEAIAPKLFAYLMAIGVKHRFSVERVGLLPDHMHMLFEGIPSICVEEYVLAIMNNTRYWMEKNYFGVLKAMEAWDVWQQSYYVGTVGEFTTAQVRAFLQAK